MIYRIVLLATAVLWLAGCGPREERDAAPERPSAQAPSTGDDEASNASAEPVPSLRDPERRRRLVDAAAADADWQPEAMQAAPEDLDTYLAQATQALEEGRVWEGERNALALYLAVLAVDPEHPEAGAGIVEVSSRIIEVGRQALGAADIERAARAGRALAQIEPQSPEAARYAADLRLQQEIALLLAEGQRLRAAGELVGDEVDSAASVYREVLKLDPVQPQALEAIAGIEGELVAAALAAAESGDYRAADQRLAEAARVGAASGLVQDAGTRIVELRQRRSAELVAEANREIMRGDLAAADRLLVEIEQVSAQSEGIEELRVRIENARIYGGFRPGQVFRDRLRSGEPGPEMVVIPVGSFMMGSIESEADRRPNEGPVHTVTFVRGFALGRHEVTVEQFRRFVAASGYRPQSLDARGSTIYDEKSGSMVERRGITWEHDHAGKRAADSMPVLHVGWNDAQAFAHWLRSETGQPYRLPSEAEFEYALRAGGRSRFPWGEDDPGRVIGNVTGDGDQSASRRSWVNAFRDYADGFWGPAPVGSFTPNPFGLHDLIGNVSEWVDDCWHDTYQRAPVDGSAWINPGCSRRVIRGASWASAPDQVRSAFRLSAAPEITNARLGFRVAREL